MPPTVPTVSKVEVIDARTQMETLNNASNPRHPKTTKDLPAVEADRTETQFRAASLAAGGARTTAQRTDFGKTHTVLDARQGACTTMCLACPDR